MRKLFGLLILVAVWFIVAPWLPAQYAPPIIGGGTITQVFNSSANGAASTPAVWFSGTPFTGGTSTTTKPMVLIETAGTPSANWQTTGTYMAINVPSSYTGRVLQGGSDGTEQWYFTRTGFTVAGAGGIFSSFGASLGNIATTTNCSSAASPAVCAAAASGSVVVAAGATTVTVNTTRVTANSQIQLTFDSSLGTKLTVTCNTTPVQPTVSARVGSTSFTITVPTTPSVNPACFSYTIFN